jgi:DNA repair protein RecO (recombination protein O)
MQWTDEGIVLGVKRHGETSVILELMTRAHGRHLGLVRGGVGRRLRAVLQPGNLVSAIWRARLEQHLGQYVVEGLNLRVASLLDQAHAVYGLTYMAALCRLLPERDPHPHVVPMVEEVLDRMPAPRAAAALLTQFELQLLADMGFGLELDRCAVTGLQSDLAYVSPKSGRAVSAEAGKPWQDKLLRLPAFLIGDPPAEPSAQDLRDGFALTGHFLVRRVFEPRGIAPAGARAEFIAAVLPDDPK